MENGNVRGEVRGAAARPRAAFGGHAGGIRAASGALRSFAQDALSVMLSVMLVVTMSPVSNLETALAAPSASTQPSDAGNTLGGGFN